MMRRTTVAADDRDFTAMEEEARVLFATLDRRDFSIVRPRHCVAPRFLPD